MIGPWQRYRSWQDRNGQKDYLWWIGLQLEQMADELTLLDSQGRHQEARQLRQEIRQHEDRLALQLTIARQLHLWSPVKRSP